MDLALPDPGSRYKSASQRARVATEGWASENLYCPRCDERDLDAMPGNTQVADFGCRSCDLKIQLKAKNGRFGASFVNSAYGPKMAAIRERRLPDYVLLSYDAHRWRVTNLQILPAHFLSESAIFPRPPLAPTARRAGWIGSTVRLGNLPPDAFVPMVVQGSPKPVDQVREDYARFAFLRNRRAESSGWLSDVLREVRRLAPVRGASFTLASLYAEAEPELRRLHPRNQHVRPKIRQQLQVLRDEGVLDFVRPGQYRMRA